MTRLAVIMILAYAMDLILGDPEWMPHPVKAIGYFAKKLEPPLRNAVRNEQLAGIIFAIGIIGLAYSASFAIIHTAANFNEYLGFVLSTVFIYTSLAIKDLKVESMLVYKALGAGKIELARKNLSLIVGRDTEHLDNRDIIRATVETIAENTVDGIVSPIFYAFLGGAPLALAYKAANTLDSMVGYKNERYKYFGWAAAKIDDFLNFVPARLSGIILPIASWLAGLDAIGSFKVALRDRRKNPSPNSGIPEAAMAGALGIKLGGLNFYNSSAVAKPFIGEDKNALDISHIKKSIKVAYLSALLSMILAVSLIYAIHALR